MWLAPHYDGEWHKSARDDLFALLRHSPIIPNVFRQRMRAGRHFQAAFKTISLTRCRHPIVVLSRAGAEAPASKYQACDQAFTASHTSISFTIA